MAEQRAEGTERALCARERQLAEREAAVQEAQRKLTVDAAAAQDLRQVRKIDCLLV